jgi:hypothetical protein
MYCLPVNDLCHLQNAFDAKTAEVAQDRYIETNSFSLGTFNGRMFTYTWFNKVPVIVIDVVGVPVSSTPDVLGE